MGGTKENTYAYSESVTRTRTRTLAFAGVLYQVKRDLQHDHSYENAFQILSYPTINYTAYYPPYTAY